MRNEHQATFPGYNPFCHSPHTQRSSLTPAARQLVGDFLAIRARMMDVVRQEFGRRFRGQAKVRVDRR